MSNTLASPEALNLYAKVEDILGVQEIAPDIYAHYLRFLRSAKFHSLLDVGCGSGDFLLQIQKIFHIDNLLGIDLSSIMVERTLQKGLVAKKIELCSVDNSYDVVTAVFDMLNYLDKKALKKFLKCASSKINQNGYLLCDINTLYGFKEVAVGSLIIDDGDRFVTIDSDFEEGKYSSVFTLFERDANQHYHKLQESIDQYYHTVEELEVMLPDMRLLIMDNVRLYSDGVDKKFLVFQKVSTHKRGGFLGQSI